MSAYWYVMTGISTDNGHKAIAPTEFPRGKLYLVAIHELQPKFISGALEHIFHEPEAIVKNVFSLDAQALNILRRNIQCRAIGRKNVISIESRCGRQAKGPKNIERIPQLIYSDKVNISVFERTPKSISSGFFLRPPIECVSLVPAVFIIIKIHEVFRSIKCGGKSDAGRDFVILK